MLELGRRPDHCTKSSVWSWKHSRPDQGSKHLKLNFSALVSSPAPNMSSTWRPIRATKRPPWSNSRYKQLSRWCEPSSCHDNHCLGASTWPQHQGAWCYAHQLTGILAHKILDWGCRWRNAVATSATHFSQHSLITIAMSTCREPLAKVGQDVFTSPFKRSLSEKPWRTSRAFARRPPLPSDAHFKTNLARKMRLRSALWGPVSTSQTPFSKMLACAQFRLLALQEC